MLDIGASELLLIMIVAVIVIGPKDLPLALRTAGKWIGKMRRLSGHFRSGLDTMIREAEVEDMEKKWKAQNEKIMREDPAGLPPESEPTGALPSRQHSTASNSATMPATEPVSSTPPPLPPPEPTVSADERAPDNLVVAQEPADVTPETPAASPKRSPKRPAKRAAKSSSGAG